MYSQRSASRRVPAHSQPASQPGLPLLLLAQACIMLQVTVLFASSWCCALACTHDDLRPGASLPTAIQPASQASPSSPTSRSRLDGPNSADTDGSTSMAAAEPRYMPAGRHAEPQPGNTAAAGCTGRGSRAPSDGIAVWLCTAARHELWCKSMCSNESNACAVNRLSAHLSQNGGRCCQGRSAGSSQGSQRC
jgi:hypothetical protein